MQSMGNVQSIQREFMSDKVLITVKLDRVSTEELQKFKSEERYQITIEKPKKKRSLSANAYFHVLVGELAAATYRSNAYIKNEMIRRHTNCFELYEGEVLVFKTQAPPEYMDEQEYPHTALHSTKIDEKGTTVYFYKIYRGTHTFNQEEMRRLIEGTVADCKELGIDTESKTSINKMLERWGKAYVKKNAVGSGG